MRCATDFEKSAFTFNGQMPAVVMRGQTCCNDPEWGEHRRSLFAFVPQPSRPHNVLQGNRKPRTDLPWIDNCCPGAEAAVYLASFKECVLIGGIQYQQNFDLPEGIAGWFDFIDTSMEITAFPYVLR